MKIWPWGKRAINKLSNSSVMSISVMEGVSFGHFFFKAELNISHGALSSSRVEPECPRGLRDGVMGSLDDADPGDALLGSGSQLA